MCIIAAKPAGTIIELDTLKLCWERNPDGAGIAVAIDGKVEIIKGLMSWQQFLTVYDEPEFWREYPMLIHFRIATHGYIDEANTHPFEVIPGKLAFAHNGIMTNMVMPSKPELSDTQVFNRYILQQLPHGFLKSAAIRRLIYGTIGYNKIAFLDGAGDITIFNEASGKMREDGVWFSNGDYKPYVFTNYYGGYKGKDDLWDDRWDWRSAKGGRRNWIPYTEDKDILNLDEMEYYCHLCSTPFTAEVDPLFADTYLPNCPNCGSATGVEEFESLTSWGEDVITTESEYIASDEI